MGKEWLYWPAASATARGGVRSAKKKGRLRGGQTQKDPPCGCMNTVFQFFDFHQFQFALRQEVPAAFNPEYSFLPVEPTSLKGVEAPRNSLEMEGTLMEVDSFPSNMEDRGEETSINIPMGIHIETIMRGTKRSKLGAPTPRTDDFSSECSSSPGSKTPTLVARLMGLDLLPGNCSATSSSSLILPNPPLKSLLPQELRHRQLTQSRSFTGRTHFDTDIIGTRSLPESPRISSARRSDVDRRLSLQINKENIVIGEREVSEISGNSGKKMGRRREVRQEEESRSPGGGRHGRQIAKQVKESVVRKVGLDITNTVGNRDQLRRDDRVCLLKAKNPSSKGLGRNGDQSSPNKDSTSSCSPRLRFLDFQKKPAAAALHAPPLSSSLDTKAQLSEVSLMAPKPRATFLMQEQRQLQRNPKQKCKKMASERYGSNLKKRPQTPGGFRNKQEEPFVRSSAANKRNLSEKKCKKTPLLSDLLNINVPIVLPVKKEKETSFRATKLSPKQSQSPVSDCKLYDQDGTLTLALYDSGPCDSSNCPTASGDGGTELQYIKRILECTGIDANTPLSSTRWYSAVHPLDPSFFHHLELSFPTAADESKLKHRCNRKLVFELVDEVLVEILRPYMDSKKPWAVSSSVWNNHPMYGSELIERVWSKIERLGSRDCRVLEDVDALIEKDLSRSELNGSTALEAEGEAIVAALELELVHSLLYETAVRLPVKI